MTKASVMTTEHPRWREFCTRLAGPDGCNFQDGPKGITGRCGGTTNRPYTVSILESMGFAQDGVRASLKYFSRHGGFCDCEILLNVDFADDEAEL